MVASYHPSRGSEITGISSGALSNITADFKKRLDGYYPEAIKDFCAKISEENNTPSHNAQDLGLKKLINEASDEREEVEAFLSSLHKEYIEKKGHPSKVVLSLQASIDF